jgi:Galactose oxidase, central domain
VAGGRTAGRTPFGCSRTRAKIACREPRTACGESVLPRPDALAPWTSSRPSSRPLLLDESGSCLCTNAGAAGLRSRRSRGPHFNLRRWSSFHPAPTAAQTTGAAFARLERASGSRSPRRLRARPPRLRSIAGSTYAPGDEAARVLPMTGFAWSQTQDVGPDARTGHAMTYDAPRGRVVLFGGAALGSEPYGDTWEWDGRDWLEVAHYRRSRANVIRGCARRGAACRGTWRLVWRGSRVAWRR